MAIRPPLDRLAAQLQRSAAERASAGGPARSAGLGEQLARTVRGRGAQAGAPPARASAPTAPLLQRYHRFESSPGNKFADYMIVNNTDPTYGDYHVKYHRIESLDIFDELHVKFDDHMYLVPPPVPGADPAAQPPGVPHWPYFFFRDDGTVIAAKSRSGRDHMPAGAEVVATAAVRAILDGSEEVSAATYAVEHRAMVDARAAREAVAAQARAAAAVIEAERVAAAAAAERDRRAASERSEDAHAHIANFHTDVRASAGELERFTSYILGPEGAPMPYSWLKVKADWYRDKIASGWHADLAPQRSAKAPTAASFRTAADLSADVPVTSIRKGARASSKAWMWTAKAEFANYSLFAKTASGRAEVAALK